MQLVLDLPSLQYATCCACENNALSTFLLQLWHKLVIVHEAPRPTMDQEEWDGVWIVRGVVDVMQINLPDSNFELTKMGVEPCFLLRPTISAAPVSEEIMHADRPFREDTTERPNSHVCSSGLGCVTCK